MNRESSKEVQNLNIAGILRHRAITEADRLAVAFLADGESDRQEYSFRQLDLRARQIAALLRPNIRVGDRVMLVFPPGLDYVAGFFGALYAGAIAVPTSAARLSRSSTKLRQLIPDCEPAVALAGRRMVADVPDDLRQTGVIWQAMEEADDIEPLDEGAIQGALHTQDLAFLQYTSGSTSTPRGVRVTHANLIHNLSRISENFGSDSSTKGVIWLPPYHDMGLIGGILQPIYGGGSVVLMPPIAFIQRPYRWLKAITEEKATVSGGPNFAYDLCLERITAEQRKTLDLSSWKVAFNGAEPIRAETITRFTQTFAECGFREEAWHPCYGLAESTLLVSGATVGEPPVIARVRGKSVDAGIAESADSDEDSRRLVSSGRFAAEDRVRIVEPATGAVLSDGRVGEIWVSSPSVADGYWKRPDESAELFAARLPGDDGNYLRTGDLGYIENGELYVTGRIKDLIILRGVNHYPQDIEATASGSHPLLVGGRSAAFSADDGSGLEQLVVVQELPQRGGADVDEIFESIAGQIADQHEIAVARIVLVGHHRLPKTSSGKIQRRQCRAEFESGSLAGVVATWHAPKSGAEAPSERPAVVQPTVAELRDKMTLGVAQRLGVDPADIDVRQPFASFGLDSVSMVELVGELEEWLDRPLSPTLGWDYPTIQALSEHLAGAVESSELQAEIADAEPIAIVGMACRFPGASNTDEYWRVMLEQIDAIGEIPESRWKIDDYFDKDPDAPGKMVTRWGGFVEPIDQFDPQFFGISPREAGRMDPQQRLLLEVTWEALEHAGLPADRVAGSKTGVFVGIGGTDYSQLYRRFDHAVEYLDAYCGTGNALSIAANRLSYVMDLKGPSMAVDTACSSALVAIHYAVQSLRQRDCDMAVAGGVNAILSPEVTIAFSKARMLSPDGRCKTFDADANGYVRGEGCGIVLFKRLADAERDGDRVLAVLRGTAVNQDGRTTGITAPNGPAQQECVRQALRQAQVTPADLTYIEAHGTGTPLGDPIEVNALRDVVGTRPAGAPKCHIGSIKANIGHLETASGVAGLIRVVLMMQHGMIPPQRNFQKLNPHIKLEQSPLTIATEPTPWTGLADGRRLAGVSGFGFGGTNAHLIVEAYRSSVPMEADHSPTRRPVTVLPISSQSEASLRMYAQRYVDWMDAHPSVDAADLAYAAAKTRTNFDYRLAILGETRDEIRAALSAYARSEPSAQAISGPVRVRVVPKVAMLFTGQGSQYSSMGQDLYDAEPSFRQSIDLCDEILRPVLDRSLKEVMFDPAHAALLDTTTYTQPALFAIEYALAQMWRSWGIEPSFVLGHSVGEFAAATIAGAMSLEDGLKLIAARGRLMGALPAGGAMAVLFAPENEVLESIAALELKLCIAAVNGPENTVVSGPGEDVEQLVASFDLRGIRSQKLTVSHAFHSQLIEPMLGEFEELARSITFRPPTIPIVSNVTGSFFAEGEGPSAEYWVRHARGAVRFSEGMQALAKAKADVYLEVGPHPSLLAMGKRCVRAGKQLWAASLRKGTRDRMTVAETVAGMFIHGAGVDVDRWDHRPSARRLVLPTYPFDRQRYWMQEDPDKSAGPSFGAAPAGSHPLLGTRLPLAVSNSIYSTSLNTRNVPSLRDHVVQGSVVLPGAAYLEASLAAGQASFGDGDHTVENVNFQQPLFLAEDRRQPVQVVISPEVAGRASFQFMSLPADADPNAPWVTHAAGVLRRVSGQAPAPTDRPIPLDLQQDFDLHLDREELYQKLRDRGMEYGPLFRVTENIWKRGQETLSRLILPEGLAAELEKFRMHPAILDGCIQMLGATIPEELVASGTGETYLPTGVGELRIHAAAQSAMWVHARLATDFDRDGLQLAQGDIDLFGDDGRLIVEFKNVTLTRIGTRKAVKESANISDWLYQANWEDLSAVEETTIVDDVKWLVFGDDAGVTASLSDSLARHGIKPVVVVPGREFARTNSGYRLRWDHADDFVRLIGEIGRARTVHIWAQRADLGPNPAEATRPKNLSLLFLVQAIEPADGTSNQLVIVTQGGQRVHELDRVDPVQASIWGLGRVIINERMDLDSRLVDLDPSATALENAANLVREVFSPTEEPQVAYRGGVRKVLRLMRSPELAEPASAPQEQGRLRIPTGGPFRLEVGATPTLDRLNYRPFVRKTPGAGEVELQVLATGLNFSDVLKAMGLYPGLKPGPVPIGIECSGVVTAVGDGVEEFTVGDEVMGIAPFSFASHAVTSVTGLVRKPTSLSHEEAATIPIAFLTAHYALHRLAHVDEGERVLIHAGAGGVGLAAIQICQSMGAEVFATAGSDEKREYLRDLGVQQVFNSRTLDFADEIREITGGSGVDVVLNSLPGEAITKSIESLGAYGRFLEIGKTDIYQNKAIGLYPFQNNLSYFAIDLDKMLREKPEYVRKMFVDVVARFEDGTYRPLPMETFTGEETVSAYRYMAQRKNIGKVVVSYAQNTVDSQSTTERSDGAVWITGGLGGLGLQLSRWLIQGGAKELVLFGRSEPTAETEAVLDELAAGGARATYVRADVSNRDQLQSAITKLPSKLARPVAVYHAAGVLDDGVLSQQSAERFERVLRAKVDGAWNLHELTLDAPLDQFVLFSSVASLFGSPGQGNYAVGNAFLDGLAHYRQSNGLPALSINWGPWGEVGMAARLGEEKLAGRGVVPMPPAEALGLLELLQQQHSGQVMAANVDWDRMLGLYPDGPPTMFAHLGSSSAGPVIDRSRRDAVLAVPTEERLDMLQGIFVEEIARVMEIDPARINPDQPMTTLGLDSLMAIELKNSIEASFDVKVPMAKFLEGPSAKQLAQIIIDLLPAGPSEVSTA